MKCLECEKELSYMDHRSAIEAYDVELCSKHRKRIDVLCRKRSMPIQAIQLYYGLKQAGAQPMMAWWDGEKFVDIAFSRVKLNIEIDTEYEMLSFEQALNDLEKTMVSYKNGFTHIRIPDILIAQHLQATVKSVLHIIESLKPAVKNKL